MTRGTKADRNVAGGPGTTVSAAQRHADRERRRALLASATHEGVRGLYDELAILCHDCGRPMLILIPDGHDRAGIRCLDCGAAKFIKRGDGQ